MRLHVLIALTLLPGAFGQILSSLLGNGSSASAACKDLETTYPDLTHYPLSGEYIKANTGMLIYHNKFIHNQS